MVRRPKDVYSNQPDAAYHSHHKLEDLSLYLNKITDLTYGLKQESDPQKFLPAVTETIERLRKIQQLAAEISMETHKMTQSEAGYLLKISNGKVWEYRKNPLKLQDLQK